MRPSRILVIDNGSVDESVAWMQANVPQAYVLRNNRNLGFCRAHNQGFRLANTKYVLCLNQDVVLDTKWIATSVRILEEHPKIGALGGVTVRSELDDTSLTGVVDSGIIDSTGIVVNRSRHAVDRDSGLKLSELNREAGSVFGLNAACIVFRVAALESIRYKDEFFDDDFFAYKDDVDTSWRLRRAGWDCWFDPSLIAYHHRSVRGRDTAGSVQLARQHRRRTLLNTWYSYRNHLLLLIKNETPATFWPDALWILWYELRKFIFLLLTKPKALTAWRDVFRLSAVMRRKGRLARAQQACSPQTIRTWFIS